MSSTITFVYNCCTTATKLIFQGNHRNAVCWLGCEKSSTNNSAITPRRFHMIRDITKVVVVVVDVFFLIRKNYFAVSLVKKDIQDPPPHTHKQQGEPRSICHKERCEMVDCIMGPFSFFCNSRPSKKKSGRIRWIDNIDAMKKKKQKRNGVVLEGRGKVGVVARLFLISCGFISFTWELLLDWLEEALYRCICTCTHFFLVFNLKRKKQKKVKYNIMLLSLYSLYTHNTSAGRIVEFPDHFVHLSVWPVASRWRRRRRCGRQRWASEKEPHSFSAETPINSSYIFGFWFLLGCTHTPWSLYSLDFLVRFWSRN